MPTFTVVGSCRRTSPMSPKNEENSSALLCTPVVFIDLTTFRIGDSFLFLPFFF